MTPNPNHEQLGPWCTRVLGSPVDQVLAVRGRLCVAGAWPRLRDGAAIVGPASRLSREAVLAGYAAYMFAKTTVELDGCAPGASVPATEHFLAAYEQARGRSWTADERQVAWAAGLWGRGVRLPGVENRRSR